MEWTHEFPPRIDLYDKQLLDRANAKLAEANTILQFLADYFREKYKLEYGTQITPTGEILNANETLFNDTGVAITENR
jgi:hypothetical protein